MVGYRGAFVCVVQSLISAKAAVPCRPR